MSHDLTFRPNGKAEMAFVGQTPWHGFGQRVTKGATIKQWAYEAGLDWDAVQAPLMFYDGQGNLITSKSKTAIFRSDNSAEVGIVGPDYKIVQPSEVLEFFRDLTEAGDWHIHTAGSLQGGSKIWVMASNHTEGEASADDNVAGNLLLATSLDGTMRTHAAMVATRVVCMNTLRIALGEKGKDSVSISHRSEFNPGEVKEQLGVARPAFETFMSKARALAESPIGQEQAREILRQLFGQPRTVKAEAEAPVTIGGGSIDGSEFAQLLARPHVSAVSVEAARKVIEHRNVPKVLELFNGAGMGSQDAGSHGTRWGLLNAVTEFVDHQAGRTAGNRLDSAWFGKGSDLKSEAFKLLTA